MRKPALAPCLLLAELAAPVAGGWYGDAHSEDDGHQNVQGDTNGNVLFYTETGGFRHIVIDRAYDAVRTRLKPLGWSVSRADESDGAFTPESLSAYDAVVFFFTSGDGDPGILTTDEKEAFQEWYRSGGGFVGVHSAADTYQTNWPWYNQLVGAGVTGLTGYLPEGVKQEATVVVEDRDFCVTSHLPEEWNFKDEWYNFDYAYEPPRSGLRVLAAVDESTYDGGTNGHDHPIVWVQEDYDGGRSFYTGLGHRPALWQDDDFVEHVVKGILWSATGDCGGGGGGGGGGSDSGEPLANETENAVQPTSQPAGTNETIVSPTSQPAGTNETTVSPTMLPAGANETTANETVANETIVDETTADEAIVDETIVDETNTNETIANDKIFCPTPIFAVNSDGPAHVAKDGTSYDADRGFSSGEAYWVTQEIVGTDDDALYRWERYGQDGETFRYSVDVTNGKMYSITFKLAEIFAQMGEEGNERLFNILVDGELVFQNVSIFEEVGMFASYDLEHIAMATGATFSIEFESVVNNAKLNAILVQEIMTGSPENCTAVTDQPTGAPFSSPSKSPSTVSTSEEPTKSPDGDDSCSNVVYAINSGGKAYEAGNGIFYEADKGNDEGKVYWVENEISGSDDDELYKVERYATDGGSLTYSVPVTEGETYLITFKLAEIYWEIGQGDNQRVFNILVNGEMAFNDVDIAAEVGLYTAYDLQFNATATGPMLTIKFESVLNDAKSGAILIQDSSCVVPSLKSVGRNGNPSSVFPLSECQGDCDSDNDCQETLICFQRNQREAVPGCSGDGVLKEDYCASWPTNTLRYISDEFKTGSLGKCEGDCDTDAECEGELVCFQRNGLNPVPGCDGEGKMGADYCHIAGESGTPRARKLVSKQPSTPMEGLSPDISNGFIYGDISLRGARDFLGTGI